MRVFTRFALAAAAIGLAVPASAATLVFTGGTASGSNGRIFTAGTGADAIRVRVSAWTANGSSISASTLGVYSGGLGVTNSVEGTGGGNSHTVDNLNRIDFLIFQFDKKVVLGNATFNAFQQTGYNYTDTDATIGWGTTATAWNSQISLANTAALNALLPGGNRYGSGNNGTQGSNTRNIDPLLYSGNVWMISAATAGFNPDGRIDSFKLNDLVYTTKMPVPEPATWMMMIVGFGLIGSAIRRRREGTAALSVA